MERQITEIQEDKTNPFSDLERLKRATSPFVIDGYDSKILEDRAYLKIEDEMLKLEYKINNLEEDLAIINDEILAAINIEDYSRAELLKEKKIAIEKELSDLNDKYFDIGAMSKFTSIISSLFKRKPKKEKSLIDKVKYFISKYIFATISKRLNFTFNMRESLSKLSDINRSVDELISLRVPFGGITGRYEKLSTYINKANDIHSKISNDVSKFEMKNVNVPNSGRLLDIKQ